MNSSFQLFLSLIIVKKSFSILLAGLILLSSLNFSLSAHYCGTKLIDVALIGDAETCSMAKESAMSPQKKSCCENRVILIEGEDYLASKNLNKQEVKKFDVLINLILFPIDLFVQKKPLAIENFLYSPPLCTERRLSILFQSFLL